jgi:hypothetical protein
VQGNGEQGGGEVLIDDAFDAVQVAVAVGGDGGAAASFRLLRR